MVDPHGGDSVSGLGASVGPRSMAAKRDYPDGHGALRRLHALTEELSLLHSDLAKYPGWLAGNPFALLSLTGVLAAQAESRGDDLARIYWRYQQAKLARLHPNVTPTHTNG